MTELLSARRLLPTLGPRIVEFGGARVEDGFAEAVRGAVEAARRQGAFLQIISARTMDALALAGIRSSALKGTLLGEAIYGDPGRRQSSDIDLLVPAERLSDAVRLVRAQGYAPPLDLLGEDGLPLLHFALVHERETLPPVELHWRVHWYETRFARERLLAPADAAIGWRPAPADELAALLLFYARDGFIGLRHAADLGGWWDALGAGLAPGALTEVIAAYPALGPVLAAATTVAERTVGLPAARVLAGAPQLRGRARIAVRLADPYPHSSEAQLYADMGLIDGLLAPPGGLGEFCKRQLAPPRAAMPAPAIHGGVGRIGFAIAHFARVLGRYALALARLPVAPRMPGRERALPARAL